MPKRICAACGEEKDVYGGKICTKNENHFVCKECYYRYGNKCPVCGAPLR